MGQRQSFSARMADLVRLKRIKRFFVANYSRLGVDVGAWRIDTSEEVPTHWQALIRRERAGLVFLTKRDFRPKQTVWLRGSGSAYLYWMSQSSKDVREISVDVSDGEWPGDARFTYSTCFSGKVLLPDEHFFRDRAYEETRRVALQAPDWATRKETIFWRGQPNNLGLFTTDPHHCDNPAMMQRLRTAMIARDLPDVDFRFVSGHTTLQEHQLAQAGLLGPRRPWQDWCGDKYAIDVDGLSNAWSNLFQRLLMGCCVLKVDSQHGFRQWYYDKLVPFETYVPVKADLSDLGEQVDWVRSHQDEAKAIAAAGQALARSMTFESETKRAARIIEEHWQ